MAAKEKKTEKKTKYAVPAVDAMLDILEFLSDRNTPGGVTEISKELGISTNLAFRIMKRLVERGYAETDSGGQYQLSTGFFSLGMKLYNRFELRRRAHKHLEKLSTVTGETTQLHVIDGKNGLVMDVVTPPADYFIQVVPGSKLHLHGDAFSKAVLAFMPEADVSAILPQKLKKLTDSTITTRTELYRDLGEVRKNGLAYDREEYNAGIFCIGAPVFDVNGEAVAGAGITGLSSRFNKKRLAEAEQAVLNCAANISKEIGYKGDFFDKRL